MTSNHVDIRIGTSGYSFADWPGRFYPEKIDKGKMLDFYVQYFPTVEINSTYYRIPHPTVFYNMTKKAPPGFDFIVKVPQSITHKRIDIDKDILTFKQAIQPLVESNTLSGLLAQFPYSFKFTKDHLDYVGMVKEQFTDHELFVEFRHNGWVNRPMYDHLRGHEIGYVCVDEPQLSGLLKPDMFATTETAYVRLHGRNREQWWHGGELRYDYDYTEEELTDWRNKIMKIKAKVKKVYVFFNNCHHGQAAKNALEFMQMLDL